MIKNKFKKTVISIVALASLFGAGITAPIASASSISSYQADEVNLQVKSAIALDSESGQVLYAKNADKRLPIASMTKLITIYLTLEAIKHKQISWNTKVEPTSAIVKVANNSEYSNVPLKKGHLYTIRQLYQATLIESANGAAMCLAQAVSGSQVAFIKKMRNQLQKWGIKDVKIYTVCGLPNGNVGSAAYPGASKSAENKLSAAEMAIVGQKLLVEYPEVIKTTKVSHMAFKDSGQTTSMTNFNWMLKGLSQYSSAYPVDGLKTGTTDAAGACFIGTLKYRGRRLITVVMGARHQDGTDPSRFVETKKLLNYIYQNYSPVVLPAKTKIAKATSMGVIDGEALKIPIGVKTSTVVWDPKDGKTLTTKLRYSKVEAGIQKGQTVNEYQFKSGNNKILTINDQPLKVSAQALQGTKKANIFVRIWRWITGTK